MTAFKIEKGIPVPPANAGMWTMLAYKMKPGESVLLKNWHEQSSLVRGFKRIGGHYTSRKVSGEGVRVWKLD